MKIAVITDTGANLEEKYVSANKNLFVVPLMILVDGKGFRDQIEITSDEVYEKLDTHTISTSLPNKLDIEATLKQVKDEGYDHVFVVSISSGLSGTFNQFRLSLQETDLSYTHIDTKSIGYQEAFMVKACLEMIKQGIPNEEIVEKLHVLRYKDSIAVYTINTLKYLKRGGRIGKVEGTIGELLRIKPVISMNDDGVYVTLSKAIGLQRSLLAMKDIMIEKFDKDLIDLSLHYATDYDKAVQLSVMLQKVLNVRELVIVKLTPVLGMHTGPDMFSYVGRRV